MDEYVQLNMSFLRAMQTGNADAALFFASEIEKKFPTNPNVKQFKDILVRHSTTIARERGHLPPPQEESESDSEEGAQSAASDDSQNDESSDSEDEGTTPTRVPSRPPIAMPTSTSRGAAPPVATQPSIRQLVTMHPSREIDDEVERMFADADRQIADEMKRYANKK